MTQSTADFIKKIEAQRAQVAQQISQRNQSLANLSKISEQLQKDFIKIFK